MLILCLTLTGTAHVWETQFLYIQANTFLCKDFFWVWTNIFICLAQVEFELFVGYVYV